MAPFTQTPPELQNQYEDDPLLRSYLRDQLPPEVFADVEPSLREMGTLAQGSLAAMQIADRALEPTLTHWDPWGQRIDRIEVTPMWRHLERLSAEKGIVATAYERKHGRFSRVHQFALSYLFAPASDGYSCPLAMTDGAAATLLSSGNQALVDRAVPRLTARDPNRFWTSGQWMTESVGGSDVGRSETLARLDNGTWRLFGRKWFTSAAASQMALTLARPEGNGPGGKGLALFYVETRDDNGHLQNIRVERLKDKLGTRKVPTAELTLEGTPATLVCGTTDGVRSMSPMLNVTRTWNAVSSVAGMRRAVALARDYAQKRVAFGAPLLEKPLHIDTLAGMQAELEAGFHLAFYAVELMGRAECGELDERGSRLLRVVTLLAKLTTGKQAVAVASEALEAFGGAGYVEDTGLPVLLRDAQVLPIWEGTTNVLSLETLRALGGVEGFDSLVGEVETWISTVKDPALAAVVTQVRRAFIDAREWFGCVAGEGPAAIEAGARRFALTLGRATALARLTRHAHWALTCGGDRRAAAAARRFATHGVSLVTTLDHADSKTLVGG